jgi:hypothetical protein
MRYQDISEIALTFRKAILKAKYNMKFNSRDRMSNFPDGCCDDSCDLLAHYLFTAYGIHTKQGNGIYRDNNPYNTTNHAWLVMNDGIIIDITADQFKFFSEYTEGIYVGKKIAFYRRLENNQIFENYDIMQDARLWSDYKIIMSNILI